MKKLLLSILLLAPALNAKLMYSPEKDIYYSTNMTPELDPVKFDTLAKYAVKMIDAAYYEDIGVIYVVTHIKEVLIADGSKEATVLYNDMAEIWGN